MSETVAQYKKSSQGCAVPGIYRNVPFEEYLDWNACSNSRLSDLRQSAAHCRYRIDHPGPATQAQVLGSAVDLCILQPELFDFHYLAAQQCQEVTQKKTQCSKNGSRSSLMTGKWYCSQHADIAELLRDMDWDERTILSQEDFLKCHAVRDAVHAHPAAKTLLDEAADFQLSAVWNDNGLLCKLRADAAVPSLSTLVDLKSTVDASNEEFKKAIFRYGYHRQGLLYLRGMDTLKQVYAHFVIIAVEKDPPYAVAVYRLKDEALDLAKRETLPLLDMYQKCQESGVWPGYGDGITEIGLPDWAEKQIVRTENERMLQP
jgi:hypothetical protein